MQIIRKSKENRTKVDLWRADRFFPRKRPSFKFLEKQKTRFLHRSIPQLRASLLVRISFKNIYIYISLAMQRDLCVSRASLPVLGVHLCDRFAMMYDSRVSLSTRASGSFPFWWNKHLFPVLAVCYVTSCLKWYPRYRNRLSSGNKLIVSFLRIPECITEWTPFWTWHVR